MRLLSVNYHYIRDEKPKNGIYPITLKELSYQIDELSKYYSFISQVELAKRIDNSDFDNKNYCLLTFDDGLKEQMGALEILNKKGIPGVFYVTTDSIRNKKVASVHQLHHIRTLLSDEEIYSFISSKVDLSSIKYPDNIESLYRYDSSEIKKLKYLLNFAMKTEKKDKLIGELFNNISSLKEFSEKLYMNKNNIKDLSQMGYLGTHTDAHLPLETLSNSNVRREIKNSLDFLYNDCQTKPILSISYPYGGNKAVSERVANISSEFGFSFGLTMSRGINENKDFNHPLMLKRIDTNDAPGGKFKSREYCL
jgi:peptidoglycan/xylan/chitin deacetylase (PgdA/CDA1 family)